MPSDSNSLSGGLSPKLDSRNLRILELLNPPAVPTLSQPQFPGYYYTQIIPPAYADPVFMYSPPKTGGIPALAPALPLPPPPPQSVQRKYQCLQCGKRYMTAAHLSRHEAIHTGAKPYECPVPGCGLRFSRSDNRAQHLRTHNNPKGKTSRRMSKKKEGE